MKILFAILLTAVSMLAQSQPGQIADHKTDKIEWKVTLVSMGVSTLMDVHSSRRLWAANTETRPWDRSKYTAISVGALAVAEVLIVHKWPKAAKVFKYINGGVTVTETTLAVSNYNTDPVIHYDLPTGVVHKTGGSNPPVTRGN